MLTYLAYTAWIYALFMLAGELDRVILPRLPEHFQLDRLRGISPIVGPAVTILLPGSGQFTNRQPLKALMVLVFPFVIDFLPRPWQMQTFSPYAMLYPWYAVQLMDATVVGLWLYVKGKHEERQLFVRQNSTAARVSSMTEFLNRRQQ